MKKLLFFLAFANFLNVNSQTTLIPDNNFEMALISLGYDTILDGVVTTSIINSVTNLDVSGRSIFDLTGIEGFGNLTQLNCENNELTELYVSSLTSLTSLYCYQNHLISIDVSNNVALDTLWCGNNQITSISQLPEGIISLGLNDMYLTTLPSLPTSLVQFSCANNLITELPELPDNLSELYCGANQLSMLPDLPDGITQIHCYNNQIESLPELPNSLVYLDVRNNPITFLPLIPPTLNDLYFNDGYLQCVTNYTNNPIIFAELNNYPLCEIEGCTSFSASNYNPDANSDDGSCFVVVYGCMEQSANNFNSDATNDNGSCLFNEEIETCSYSIQEEYIPLELQEGWGMFGYTCFEPVDVAFAFESIIDKVTIVKDNNGDAILPEWNYNGIGDLVYSRGYQIKMSEEVNDFSFCPIIVVIEINPQREVGDLAEGGIVFYVDETGEHGLVAAMEDLGTYEEWGCYGTSITGADGTAIGTGYQNTLDIVAECTTESGGVTAAQAALDYESEGYTDWYLPALFELEEMYNIVGGYESWQTINNGFSSGWYWSSTEASDIEAYGYSFYNNTVVSGGNKFFISSIRPIRSF